MSEKTVANQDKMYKLLENAIPENAVDYCLELWLNFPFHFKITRDRRTKLGDYRFHHHLKSHAITVNQGLNPYAFLITYIHEVAHRVTMEEYGRKVKPHGKEWKHVYGTLLKSLLAKNIFPKDITIHLIQHIHQPKASSCADPALYEVLKKYDPEFSSNNILLKNIKTGEKFIFRNKIYIKELTKRTRALCKEVSTGKKWLIPLVLEVDVIQAH